MGLILSSPRHRKTLDFLETSSPFDGSNGTLRTATHYIQLKNEYRAPLLSLKVLHALWRTTPHTHVHMVVGRISGKLTFSRMTVISTSVDLHPPMSSLHLASTHLTARGFVWPLIRSSQRALGRLAGGHAPPYEAR